VRVRLGVYDPEINVRTPVLASTLPVADESSAVWITDAAAGAAGSDGSAADDLAADHGGYAVRFEATPLAPSGLEFEGGDVFAGRIELAGWSAVWHEDLLWLRLKWIFRRRPAGWRGGRPRALRFFAHLVDEPGAAAPARVQLDQDLAPEDRGPATAVEQNIVRAAPRSESQWLRCGLCTAGELIRLPIAGGPVEFDAEERCAYWRLPGGGTSGSQP
jgi:hypothetical protein